METEKILEKMMLYFNVVNYSQLADKIGVAQQNISKWKSRNSINAIKVKCRELGIYNEIFGDINSNINNQTIRDNLGYLSQTGNVYGAKNNDEDDLNFDEAAFAMFKRAYSKCLDADNAIIESRIDELITHLAEFR